MKKSINISDIMINSDRFYKTTQLQPPKNQIVNNHYSNSKHYEEKIVISPWIDRQQQKSYSPKNQNRVLDHSFLNHINYKNKAKFSKTQRINNEITQRSIKQAKNQQQQQTQNIILFPKTAKKMQSSFNVSPNNKLYKSFYRQHPDQPIFCCSRAKWRDRKVKKSTIISLNIEASQQYEQINPEKNMSLTKAKAMNPYQKNQKRKEIMKFKIKKGQQQSTPQPFEKKLQLQKYLKMMTELPTNQQKINKGKIRTLQPKAFHQNKSLNLENKNGLIICQGQLISNKKFRRFSVKRLNTQSHFQETLFLC